MRQTKMTATKLAPCAMIVQLSELSGLAVTRIIRLHETEGLGSNLAIVVAVKVRIASAPAFETVV